MQDSHNMCKNKKAMIMNINHEGNSFNYRDTSKSYSSFNKLCVDEPTVIKYNNEDGNEQVFILTSKGIKERGEKEWKGDD